MSTTHVKETRIQKNLFQTIRMDRLGNLMVLERNVGTREDFKNIPGKCVLW